METKANCGVCGHEFDSVCTPDPKHPGYSMCGRYGKTTTDEIMELLEPVKLSGEFLKAQAEFDQRVRANRPLELKDLKHGEFSASTLIQHSNYQRKVAKRYVDLEAEICGAATESFPVGSDSWAIFVRFHMVAVMADALLEAFQRRDSHSREYANLARAIQYELEISEDI